MRQPRGWGQRGIIARLLRFRVFSREIFRVLVQLRVWDLGCAESREQKASHEYLGPLQSVQSTNIQDVSLLGFSGSRDVGWGNVEGLESLKRNCNQVDEFSRVQLLDTNSQLWELLREYVAGAEVMSPSP